MIRTADVDDEEVNLTKSEEKKKRQKTEFGRSSEQKSQRSKARLGGGVRKVC